MCNRCQQYQKELFQLKKTQSELTFDYHSTVQRINFLQRQNKMLYNQNIALNNSLFQQHLENRTLQNYQQITKNNSKQTEMNSKISNFQNKDYRSDEQKNRNLNLIIDTKNRDIIELKKKLQDVQQLKKQNILLKAKIQEVMQIVETQSNKLAQYQRQKQNLLALKSYPSPNPPYLNQNNIAKTSLIRNNEYQVPGQKSTILDQLRINKSDLVSTKANKQDEGASSKMNVYPNSYGINKVQATSVYRCNGENINQSFYNQKLNEFYRQLNNKSDNDRSTLHPSVIQSSIYLLQKQNRQLRKILATKI